MEKLGVVILNYLNYKDTIECIESLKSDKYPNKEIIVVDNASKNESWDVLSRKYNEGIHLLRSEENLGFAKGNNLGIEFARKKLNCSFVLLVNNDTIFKEEDFLIKLMESYEPGIGAIGPRIVSAIEEEQNPVPVKESIEKTENDLKMYKDMYEAVVEGRKSFKDNIIYRSLKKIKFLKNIKSKIRKAKEYNPINDGEFVNDTLISKELVLHGSCLMLTKDYFEFYPTLFPGTFLYYEEDILAVLMNKVGLKRKLIFNTWIYHKEDQSSLMSFNNATKIKLEYQIESIEKCLEIYNLSYSEIINNYFNK